MSFWLSRLPGLHECVDQTPHAPDERSTNMSTAEHVETQETQSRTSQQEDPQQTRAFSWMCILRDSPAKQKAGRSASLGVYYTYTYIPICL